MYRSADRLIIFDADGTLIDAFSAIGIAFAHHGMNLKKTPEKAQTRDGSPVVRLSK